MSAAPAQEADDRPPGPPEAMRAYEAVEEWVRDWTLPSDAGGFPEAAACVTLRFDGDVVGRGQDYRADDRSLWRAAMQAMAQVPDRVGVANDATRAQAMRLFADRLAISVELAGPLTPFEPATYAEVEATLSPGVDGVAVRIGRTIDGMFAGSMLSANLLPHEALAGRIASVVGNAAAGLEEPGRIAAERNIVYYRFKSVHLAQPGAREPPSFLKRGGRVVLRHRMNGAALRQMADDMARHLVLRIGSEEDGQGGAPAGYRPWLDRYEDDAAPESLFLAAIALERWAAGVGGADPEAGEAVEAARRAALALPAVGPVGEADVLPLAFATVLLAHGPDEPGVSEWLGGAARVLAGLHTSEGGFAPAVRAHAQGPVAWALVEAGAAGNPDALDAAEAAIRRLYRETQEGRLVQHMPWLGWAEVRLADARGEGQIPAAAVLRRMREEVWTHQIQPLDVDTSGQDLVGGIVFTSSGNPLPTWQALRPLAFVATMLADERLTDPNERSSDLVHLLTSLRFLRQLQADDVHGWMFKRPERARGGVRSALWDQRMPADATSLGLLTTTEALASLERLARAREP